MRNIQIGQRVHNCTNPKWPTGVVVAKTTTSAEFYRKNRQHENSPDTGLEYNSLLDGWFRVKFPVPVDILGDGNKVYSAIFMPGELIPAA